MCAQVHILFHTFIQLNDLFGDLLASFSPPVILIRHVIVRRFYFHYYLVGIAKQEKCNLYIGTPIKVNQWFTRWRLYGFRVRAALLLLAAAPNVSFAWNPSSLHGAHSCSAAREIITITAGFDGNRVRCASISKRPTHPTRERSTASIHGNSAIKWWIVRRNYWNGTSN